MPSQIKVDEIKNVAGQYKIKTDTFDGQTTSGSIVVTSEGTSATTNLQQGLCKCFANLDMTAGTQVQNSFNLTSMTDNATGQPQLNFTNLFSNAKFCLTGTHDVYSARAGGIESSDDRGNTTSISKMRVNNSSGTTVDSREIMLEVVGDLA